MKTNKKFVLGFAIVMLSLILGSIKAQDDNTTAREKAKKEKEAKEFEKKGKRELSDKHEKADSLGHQRKKMGFDKAHAQRDSLKNREDKGKQKGRQRKGEEEQKRDKRKD